MLAKQLEHLGAAIKQLQQNTLHALVFSLAAAVHSKRSDVEGFAYQIWMFVYNTIGQNDFLSLLGAFLTPQQQGEIIKGKSDTLPP